MNHRRLLRLTATAALLACGPALLPLHAAHAQFSMGGPGGGGGGDADRDAQDAQATAQAKAEAKAKAPPPAIPGAVTDEATATSSHAGSDLEPTAALFDSINRGDLTSAKDALSRGADLSGRNELGQSAIDMAIDLNRNDITFLLLSMRNSEGGAPVASVASASGTARAGSADDEADSSSTSRHGRHLVIKGRSSRVAAAHETPHARAYASDGGAPKPDVGFLGFGGS